LGSYNNNNLSYLYGGKKKFCGYFYNQLFSESEGISFLVEEIKKQQYVSNENTTPYTGLHNKTFP